MRQVWMAGAVLLLSATAAVGRDFEGTVKLRTTAATAEQLAKANGGAAPDEAKTLALTPAALAKDGNATVKESVVYVSKSKVRMDMPLETKGSGYAIVDLEKGVTWFVVPAEKRYIEWSESDAQAIGEKMAAMKKMMTERMGSLPPEQRKQVEAMLKNMNMPGDEPAAPPAKITPLDKTQTINGMAATAYKAVEDDATIVAWVTNDQPDLNQALLEVTRRMEKLTPSNMRRENVRHQLQAKGLPVMVQSLSDGRYRVEEVLSVTEEPVDAALFVVPQDFAKTTGRDALKNIPNPGGAAAPKP